MLRHKIFSKQFSFTAVALAITLFVGTESALAVQEVKVGFIPGSDVALEESALNLAGIEYELFGRNDYTLNRLLEFDVIGVGSTAYDSNADLKANFELLKEYVVKGGYLVTLDFQQDSSWNQDFMPHPLSLLDPDLEDDVGVILADHEIFHIPNEITEEHFGAGIWGAGDFMADGPQQISAPWEALVTDRQNNWPIVVGAPAGKGYVVFNSLQMLQSLGNLGNNEVVEVLQNFLFWRGPIGSRVKAFGPGPKDGVMLNQTWVTLTWTPGVSAVSHNIYIGDNFDDVNDGAAETFQINQTETLLLAGFPGYPYPEGLVPGTTYYWRIDEVNDSEPNSPWKGNVWSFSITPKTAFDPVPVDGTESVALDMNLTWAPGFGAKLHYVVFGEDFDEVSNAATGVLNGPANYKPGPLKWAKTYYWRVDESDGFDTYKGQVWSFTTVGAISNPYPADGAEDVKPSVLLGWDAGAIAASHEVYFGSDADAVANATKASADYKGTQALGQESYNPGRLSLNTTYFWRVDEINDVNPDSPWPGDLWSFTTGNFFVIDDFEDYDATGNQIWFAWHDGLGAGAPGTPGYLPGNGTGSAVGDETTASYTEETIVNDGAQSMPVVYDNNKQGLAKYSEVELTLTEQRDWTAEGVSELSLWFRGYSASVGSFVEGPLGTYTMTGSGADIWAVNGVEADEFHFAYKMLSGTGSLVAKVVSIGNTNNWAKAGVMIRETLNPDSSHAMMVVTPAQGASFQRRPGTGATSLNTDSTGIVAPYWVKIERSISGNFTGSISANGSTWTMVGTENVPMGANVYIGLAVTSHDTDLACQAVFTNVTTTGNVTGQWTNQDIGIASNDAEPLYVAVSNSAGASAIVVHDDPAAAQIDTWTEWLIPLSAFTEKGIDLANVDRIAIGLGTQGNTATPGGSGKMYIDDIRLYQPR